MAFIKAYAPDPNDTDAAGYAKRLNTSILSCYDHPDEETVLRISSVGEFVTVEHICCDKFRQMLVKENILSPNEKAR